MTTHNVPSLFGSRNIADQTVLVLVFMLACLPFSQIVYVPLPGLTLSAYESLWLALVGVLATRILMAGYVVRYVPLLVFAVVVLYALVVSVLGYGVSPKDALIHLRMYLPFAVALLLIAAGTTVSSRVWLNTLLAGALIGAGLALFLHHIVPSVLQNALGDPDNPQAFVAERGRLYWGNVSLAFFPLLVAMCRDLKCRRELLLAASLFTLLALLNTLNRTSILGYVLFPGLAMLGQRSATGWLKSLLQFVAFAAAGAIIVIVLMQVDSRVADLIRVRSLGIGSGADVAENAAVVGRLLIYQQYAQSLATYFPIGQGLGRPFSNLVLTGPIYTSDVSLMSFVLPFGILGVVALGAFVASLAVVIRSLHGRLERGSRFVLLSFLGVFVLMAFNIDYFAQNNFVVFFAALLMSLHRERAPLMR